ncbi:MAG TPA: DNA-3-methyladenine glycosylase 2 family protein [Puia sp.]|jgi:DNA-3-methyladenine glycosylase II
MEYISHLSKDKKFKKLIEGREPFKLKKRKHVHLHLCGSIMCQQLSTKVADVIYKRFLALFETKTPTPEQILAIAPDKLRAIGLSNAKASYVHNVSRFAIEKGMDYKHLNKLTNDEVINYLTQIKGVGRWTTEMLLMFTLGREDVFAVDDLGIQNAMIKLYKLDNSNKKELREKLLKLSEKWSPYRTYACIHLWRWKDNKPI